ncbi:MULTISPECIES: hypothetical protein [Neisseria]|uniref:hypothetical protein n=1 Tax=Neisseria TaxID=482 RepID=UPI001864BE64|nr:MULTISPECIES: hypothetical protein [Neisseria]
MPSEARQSIQCRLKRTLPLLNFQIIFEYCRRPKVWIPACAGMTVGRMRRHHDFSLFP